MPLRRLLLSLLPWNPSMTRIQADWRSEPDSVLNVCNRNFSTAFERILQTSIIWRFTLGVCWSLLHLFVSLVHVGSSLIHVLLCYIISTRLLGKYQNLDLSNLKYIAIVVDSKEAKCSERIKRLFHWLSSIGVKNIILYDMEGVLKKSIGSDQSSSNSKNTACFEGMTIELLSFSDNKEGVAKAASFLCSKYLKSNAAVSDKVELAFTEADMANALTAVGCGGPDPDLILVYGPARCHLGFPAWRMRYTEIVHMGSLKTMRYGATVKAIYDFSRKHQNYGT